MCVVDGGCDDINDGGANDYGIFDTNSDNDLDCTDGKI